MKEERNIRVLSWELTSECNLKCKHCYNAVPLSRGFDLNFEQQLKICDQIIDANIKSVQLTGGEILLSQGWKEVASKLIAAGIRVSIITNTLLLTESIIQEISKTGISAIGLSVEGLKSNNDSIRGKNTYQQIMQAIELIYKCDPKISILVNTTINRYNIDDLKQLAVELHKRHVSSWMVQLAVPDGNFKINKDEYMIYPSQMDDLIDIMYEIWKSIPIHIFLGDCIGHFNSKEIEIRSSDSSTYGLKTHTEGCSAGKYMIGIKANGDVVGCISLKEERYVEGNLNDITLKKIITDTNSFSWNRIIKSKKELVGDCAKCEFGDLCKSGCPALKYDENYQLIENIYCSYNYAIKQERERINHISDLEVLKKECLTAQEEKNLQLVDIYNNRLYNLTTR